MHTMVSNDFLRYSQQSKPYVLMLCNWLSVGPCGVQRFLVNHPGIWWCKIILGNKTSNSSSVCRKLILIIVKHYSKWRINCKNLTADWTPISSPIWLDLYLSNTQSAHFRMPRGGISIGHSINPSIWCDHVGSLPKGTHLALLQCICIEACKYFVSVLQDSTPRNFFEQTPHSILDFQLGRCQM